MKLVTELHPYQHDGADRLANSEAGALAFQPGLGKTIVFLEACRKLFEAKKMVYNRVLIVCPTTVIMHIYAEIRKHYVDLPDDSIYIYHGVHRKSKEKRAAFCSHADHVRFIITSYDTVLRDVFLCSKEEVNPDSFLRTMEYDVYAVDEFHVLANIGRRTRAILSLGLHAAYRWAITGTPWQNSKFDLGTMAKFFNIQPYNTDCFWKDHEIDSANVKQWVRKFIIFHSKAKLDLPKLTAKEDNVVLRPDEKRLYIQIAEDATQTYNASEGRKKHTTAFLKIFELRQAAVCANLVIDRLNSHTTSRKRERDASTPEPSSKFARTEDILNIMGSRKRERDTSTTEPSPKFARTEDILDILGGESDAESDEDVLAEEFECDLQQAARHPLSSKTDALFALIKKHQNEKIVVFSQWRTYFDNILPSCPVPYRVLHGGMTLSQRSAAISDMATKPEVRVLFATLKTGGVGVDYTFASVCIQMDMWFNPVPSQQAVDRLHRIGQLNPVTAYTVVANETIESWIRSIKFRKIYSGRRCLGTEEYLACGSGADRPNTEEVDRFFKKIIPNQIETMKRALAT